jgi:putative restriction endonuclease
LCLTRRLKALPRFKTGLALCALHHTAYDRNVLRIRPDYEIRIAGERIHKNDPFAQVALADFDGRRLTLPRDSTHHPNREFLADRYDAWPLPSIAS